MAEVAEESDLAASRPSVRAAAQVRPPCAACSGMPCGCGGCACRPPITSLATPRFEDGGASGSPLPVGCVARGRGGQRRLAGRCADVTLVLGPTGLRLGELCGLRFGTWSPCRVPDGQWYLHLFTPQQPDLNWDNPGVRQEFLTTLAFWADRGVDGFRIDVAHMLAKDLSRPMPSHLEVTADIPLDGSHRFYDRDQVHEIYRVEAAFRQLRSSPDGGRGGLGASRAPPPIRLPGRLGQAFNFDLLRAPWSAEAFRAIINRARSSVCARWPPSRANGCKTPRGSARTTKPRA